MIVKSTQQRTVKIMVRHTSTTKQQATVEKTFPPDFYLRFAEKVLWVREGDNPPLTPPVEGKTGDRKQDKWGIYIESGYIVYVHNSI